MSIQRFYIKHTDKTILSNGTVYFGPFDVVEGRERINDAYADLLSVLGDVEAMLMTDEQASKFYINSPDYWMEALEEATNGWRGNKRRAHRSGPKASR